MSDVSKIVIEGVTLNIKDTVSRNGVNTLTNNVNNLNTTVQELSGKVDGNGKYIFIGDSYGAMTAYSKMWYDYCADYLGVTEYYANCKGGYGFATTYNAFFIDLLKELSNRISNKSAITDIVVGGGFNDRTIPVETIELAISEFCTYVKNTYPNARVWLGGFGWSFNGEFITELENGNYLRAYKNVSKYGGYYLAGTENIMHDKNLYLAEDTSVYNLQLVKQYVHPNVEGAKSIGSGVANAIMSGYCSVTRANAVIIDCVPGCSLQKQTMYEYQNDGVVTMKCRGLNFNIPSTNFTFTNGITVATIDNGLVGGTYGNFLGQFNGFVVPKGGSNTACAINVFLINNQLNLQPLIYAQNVTTIYIQNGLITMPVVGC